MQLVLEILREKSYENTRNPNRVGLNKLDSKCSARLSFGHRPVQHYQIAVPPVV